MSELVPLVPFLMILHLVGVMAGIGPTFAFARISALGRTEPVHSTFAVAVVRAIQRDLTVPLALLTLGSGFAMMWILGYDLARARWLTVSILLFLSSFGWAVLVQNRDLLRIIEITSRGSPPLEREARELRRRRTRVRRGGLYMRAVALAILALMVLKPF